MAIAAADSAVWIGHLRDAQSPYPFKLPATRVLGDALRDVPAQPVDSPDGYGEILYEEEGGAGFLHFRFYNGAMGTEACERLLAAYRAALARPTRVLVLMGGPDFWSNGMNLNLIEAAPAPPMSSGAISTLSTTSPEAILSTEGKLTVAALQGNAGAGGVFLARAADYVWLREGVVLSPHYKDMGNLYGSEFWTYSLPASRRAGNGGSDHAAKASDGLRGGSSHRARRCAFWGNAWRFRQQNTRRGNRAGRRAGFSGPPC